MITILKNELDKLQFAEKIKNSPIDKPIKVVTSLISQRSLEANNYMWARLTDIANQVEIPVTFPNGETILRKMSKEQWKHYLSGHMEGLLQVEGIDGGLVMLGQETSKMSIKKMHELTEFVELFGDSKSVEWSDA